MRYDFIAHECAKLSYEVNPLYIAGLLALILEHAGPFSIDRLLAQTVDGD
jgi:hypothetical protein